MHSLIRLWDEDNKKFDIKYFDSSFLDGATATDIQEGFMSGIKEFDKNNFLQITSDGPKFVRTDDIKQRNLGAFTTYGHWNLWTAYSPQQSKSRNQIISVDFRESHESCMEIT